MTLEEVASLKIKTQGLIWCVAVSPDENWIAVTGSSRKISIFNAKTFEHEQEIDEDLHQRTIRHIGWHPKSDMFAASCFDRTTTLWFLEENKFHHVATVTGHENEVKCSNFNVTGNLLATCSRDKSIFIHDVSECRQSRWIDNDHANPVIDTLDILQEHTQDVKFVIWHPVFEDMFFSASYDNTLKIFAEKEDAGKIQKEHDEQNDEDEEEDEAFYSCIQTLEGHDSTVWQISFLDEGRKFASCSEDGSVKIWAQEQEYCNLFHLGAIGALGPCKSFASGYSTRISKKKADYHCVFTLEPNTFKHRPVYSIKWVSQKFDNLEANLKKKMKSLNEEKLLEGKKIQSVLIAGGGDNQMRVILEILDLKRYASEWITAFAITHRGDVNCVTASSKHIFSSSDDVTCKVWAVQK